jgi:hypothetical protein
MQCPDCGYDVDDAAVFCPQCRFRFRHDADEPAAATDTVTDVPGGGVIVDDGIFEDTERAFTDKELRLLEVQLIQPAVLVVLIISLLTYSVIFTVPFVPITIAGLNIGVTGIICLACGLFCGLLFFFLTRRSLLKFRFR